MMRWGLPLALAGLALTGCAEITATADQTARDAAKRGVTPVVQAQFPGLPVEPIVDCVVQYAEWPEVLELARAATLGPTSETTRVVIDVASRPDTVRCIATAQAEAFVAGRIAL